MSKQTDYFKKALKALEHQPQIIISGGKKEQSSDSGTNLARQVQEFSRKMMKEYYEDQLYKAQLEEIRQTAREAVTEAIAQADISVNLNGEKITEAIIKQFNTKSNG